MNKLDKELKQLEKQYAAVEKQIEQLKEKKAAIYEQMKDVARRQGEAATECPPWLDLNPLRLGYVRRRAYLQLHQDECGHGSILYAPHDGENTPWYHKCNDCDKTITEEDRRKFIDI